MKIRVRKLDSLAKLPLYGTEFAAGADLCARLASPLEIPPGESAFIGTGLAFEIPAGFVGLVYARSGLACRQGLAPANKVGVVDADYRGEVKVCLHNHSGLAQVVADGERIAQLVVAPVVQADFEEVPELSETARGAGGFGSTGR